MSGDLDRLPPDIKAMLRAEKVRTIAPVNGRARLAARLGAAVPAFGRATGSAPACAPPMRVTHGATKAGTAKAIFALALGVGAVALATRQDMQPPTRSTAMETARPHVQMPTATIAVAPPHAVGPTEKTAEKTMEKAVEKDCGAVAPLAAIAPPAGSIRVASSSSSPKHTSPSPTPAASLLDEQRLLDAAHASIVRGEPEAALVATATHAARFPKGTLSEERDALRIRALARLGRKADARALLTAMRATFPKSFLLDGAEADVDAIP